MIHESSQAASYLKITEVLLELQNEGFFLGRVKKNILAKEKKKCFKQENLF